MQLRGTPDSLAATSREAVGKLLGVRHTTRHRLRRAACEERGREPGRWEPHVMEKYALRTPSPLLRISVGKMRWWGVAMAVGSAPERW